MSPSHLEPSRLLPQDPATCEVALRLYADVQQLPIVSAHGHVDARIIADDLPFDNPAALLVTPDHYVTRLLHSHGVPLEQLGVASQTPSVASPREVWRILCQHWWAFRGTPSRYWLETELACVFDIVSIPSAATADLIYDQLCEKLADPEFRPRALMSRFGVEVLATTDDACSELGAHAQLRADAGWSARVIPTFRPDPYLDPSGAEWRACIQQLGAVSELEVGDYAGYVAALEQRRAFFAEHGATSSDHGPPDAGTDPLSPSEATRIYAAARRGEATAGESDAFRRHMLLEMARMSCDDGLVMQLHPGVLRGHHDETTKRFGPDTGHDIPVATEFTKALRPMLARYGTSSAFRLVVYTVDDTTWTRELAPLAGFYPSVFLGAPWWFLDSPEAMLRFRRSVTDTVGFYKTAGFVDDTRAFCSIPARHDTARRVDCAFLAELVVAGMLPEDEARETAIELTNALPRRVFNLT